MDNALLEKAFQMPPNERVVFAELILASIDYEEDKIRQSWSAEVSNRIKAVNEGGSKWLDFESLYNEDRYMNWQPKNLMMQSNAENKRIIIWAIAHMHREPWYCSQGCVEKIIGQLIASFNANLQ